MHAHGFPNCILMGATQAGFTVNFPHMLDEVSTLAARNVTAGMATTAERWCCRRPRSNG